MALAAAAVIVIVGATLLVRQGHDTDPRLVPATPAPQTTPDPTTPHLDHAGDDAARRAGR